MRAMCLFVLLVEKVREAAKRLVKERFLLQKTPTGWSARQKIGRCCDKREIEIS